MIVVDEGLRYFWISTFCNGWIDGWNFPLEIRLLSSLIVMKDMLRSDFMKVEKENFNFRFRSIAAEEICFYGYG